MHRANVAIFLTAVGLMGIAPVILTAVYLARKRVDARSAGDARATGHSTVVVVVVVMAVLLIGGGSAAWVLSARGLGAPPSQIRGDMAGSGGMPGMDPADADPGMRMSLPVLDRLGGLQLTSSVTGAEAIDQVAALHGSSFPIRDAVIATYANGRTTIWVSMAPDRETATAQVASMVETIDSSGSPFVRPSPVPGFRGVYETSGMGQRHFFFARGDTVWWVAADPTVASAVLDDILEVAT